MGGSETCPEATLISRASGKRPPTLSGYRSLQKHIQKLLWTHVCSWVSLQHLRRIAPRPFHLPSKSLPRSSHLQPLLKPHGAEDSGKCSFCFSAMQRRPEKAGRAVTMHSPLETWAKVEFWGRSPALLLAQGWASQERLKGHLPSKPPNLSFAFQSGLPSSNLRSMIYLFL